MASDSIAFNTFTEFLLHMESVCYHLQREAVEKQMEQTINDLHDESMSAVLQLEVLNSKASSISHAV